MKPLVGGSRASETTAGGGRNASPGERVGGGHGERERNREHDRAGEVHERLAAGAAAHGLRRRGLEVDAQPGEVVGQLGLAAHPAGSFAGPSTVVSVRSARETRSRAAFSLQPSSPATSS